ncbi:MAG: hypothetical protein JWO07_579 [Candidatus Saccharibacteria bacterium]|nr:hypothetical protein [Candidatus Saccharibacteria bacterium]
MAGLFKRLLTGSTQTKSGFTLRSKPTMRELIQAESEIGGNLFGHIPTGHHRQFFNLDRHTWVWYEEWLDDKGKANNTTTRYEIHENGILKVQDGKQYYYIEGEELTNLVTAIRMYYEQVSRDVYRRDPSTGKLLTV